MVDVVQPLIAPSYCHELAYDETSEVFREIMLSISNILNHFVAKKLS